MVPMKPWRWPLGSAYKSRYKYQFRERFMEVLQAARRDGQWCRHGAKGDRSVVELGLHKAGCAELWPRAGVAHAHFGWAPTGNTLTEWHRDNAANGAPSQIQCEVIVAFDRGGLEFSGRGVKSFVVRF